MLSTAGLAHAAPSAYAYPPTAAALAPSEQPPRLQLSQNVASLSQKRKIRVKFKLPKNVSAEQIQWTYGGKPLSQWKSFDLNTRDYTGKPFIRIAKTTVKNGELTAELSFDLAYGVEDLGDSGLLQPPRYLSLMGTFELQASVAGKVLAQAPIKLVPYDSFHTYDELKPEIDKVTAQAAKQNDRYIKTSSIGKSVEGRDIYMTVVARDKDVVDNYLQVTHPAMMNDPAKLRADIESGRVKDYQVPIWLNNIHPHESPGVDAIVNYFKSMALDDAVNYKTTSENGQPEQVNMKTDDTLNDVFFIFVYTDNPDGMTHTMRTNAEFFDLNRDNSYQTQPETQSVTQQIAKWSPLSFLDMHGFDTAFLIEPSTPPHDPNVEYDLLIDSMVEQAKAMGEAGIANTKYDYYHIPYVEHQKKVKNPAYESKGTSSGWDDASPVFTAMYAMHHGALGHTLETPEMNEESVRTLYYSAAAATHFVQKNKQKLFFNQLKIYERGIDNIDDPAVDRYLVNAKEQAIGRPRKNGETFFPDYYVLPVDRKLQKNPLEAYRMIQYLLRNGIKVERSEADVSVGSATYPAGSFVVNMRQAERALANTVLYDGPDVSDFESVAATVVQNFADLRGFDRYTIREAGAFADKTVPVSEVSIPKSKMPERSAYIRIANTNNDAIKAVNALLNANKTVTMLTTGGDGYEAGDFAAAYDDLEPLASDYTLDLFAFGDQPPAGKKLEAVTVSALGEAAYVLRNLGFKVAGEPNRAGVLVNTFDSDKLVEAGVPYIAYGRMGMQNIQEWMPGFAFASPDWESYEGLFLTDVKQDNPITAPYDEQEYFYTSTGAYVTKLPKPAQVLASISSRSDFFKAGWWPGHDKAKGKTLAFTYKGDGKHITVFANELTNIGHPQHQYRLLANAIFDAETGSTSSNQASAGAAFSDLGAATKWAGAAVKDLSARGMISGVAPGRFAPNKPVTRAEFLTLIVRALDLREQQVPFLFNDVHPERWSYRELKAAAAAGLAGGTGNRRLQPDRPITREEMAVIVAKAFERNRSGTAAPSSPGSKAPVVFSDQNEIADYAQDAAALLSANQIIQGLDDSKFGPKQTTTRAQAAVIVSRMLDAQKGRN
ncbi:hypothetical protein GYN08_07375 [Saccharibacillus sp. VR-M41]|uniref:Zinc carboxypeptidase n=2 Tax=Saccharibacillus alkalitolerans TaxID=2705290 RepID=A0ABX0F6G1_9BACL|nr:hypothetical protein [Saccharibacillus alkalitolerans]